MVAGFSLLGYVRKKGKNGRQSEREKMYQREEETLSGFHTVHCEGKKDK